MFGVVAKTVKQFLLHYSSVFSLKLQHSIVYLPLFSDVLFYIPICFEEDLLFSFHGIIYQMYERANINRNLHHLFCGERVLVYI